MKRRNDWDKLGPKIEEARESGSLSLKEICKEYGLSVSAYHSWVHRTKGKRGKRRPQVSLIEEAPRTHEYRPVFVAWGTPHQMQEFLSEHT